MLKTFMFRRETSSFAKNGMRECEKKEKCKKKTREREAKIKTRRILSRSVMKCGAFKMKQEKQRKQKGIFCASRRWKNYQLQCTTTKPI